MSRFVVLSINWHWGLPLGHTNTMSSSRPSLEIEQGKNVQAAKALHAKFQSVNLQFVNTKSELNSHKMDSDEELELADGVKNKDPGIVTADVAAQIVHNDFSHLENIFIFLLKAYLRKLKFQYLEQNAKDKYIKSIVSDIDDAPIVTAEENKELSLLNEEKKEKLKAAKQNLVEVQQNVRLLAPLVEQGAWFRYIDGVSNSITNLIRLPENKTSFR